MNFKLPDFNYQKHPKVVVGERTRWATATSSCFVNDNLILIASFLNKKIYLFDIENQKIINEIDTKKCPDLMDYKDGLIVTSERDDYGKVGSLGIFKLIDNKITYKKNVEFKEFTELHGVRFIDSNQIVFTNKAKDKSLCLFNLSTNKVNIIKNFEYPPCDIFILDNKILAISSETKPNSNGFNYYEVKMSHIHLLETLSLDEIDKISFEGQVDSICFENGVGFITIQSNDSLYKFELKENKLLGIGEVKNNFNFPHGISMRNGKICVTNYGTNSVDILNYNEL